MVLILLSSPLQPQSETKVVPDKKAMLMTVGFLLANPMLNCSMNEKQSSISPISYINLHNEIYYLLYMYCIRGWVKAQEAFDQLLLY